MGDFNGIIDKHLLEHVLYDLMHSDDMAPLFYINTHVIAPVMDGGRKAGAWQNILINLH
jgi:hypothetical protein